MKRKMRRQGDVGLVEVKEEIDFSNYKRSDDLVLALGEITGHKHMIVAERPADVEIYENSFEKLINVKGENVRLYHGNESEIKMQVDAYKQGVETEIWKEKRLDIHIPHKPIDLPKGIHRFQKQREFDPEGNRFVED